MKCGNNQELYYWSCTENPIETLTQVYYPSLLLSNDEDECSDYSVLGISALVLEWFCTSYQNQKLHCNFSNET